VVEVVPQEPERERSIQATGVPNPVAFGALSANALSSTAYGPEQILIELLPAAGMAAFALLLPVVGVVALLLVFLAASQRQVVTAYTRAGGAYLAARANFALPVAQIAAAALVLDSVTTVAVQSAAATIAIVSAIPASGPYSLPIAISLVFVVFLINLGGSRKVLLPLALATYFFLGVILLTIGIGIVRYLLSGLPMYDPAHLPGALPVHQGNGLIMGATALILLRAFANGTSSLAGVETISNSVNVFREPKGANARRALTAAAGILGFLLLGVAWLAHVTHAVPYFDEYPSVLSQITRAVYGSGVVGRVLFLLVQAATAAVLFAGASSGFRDFRALTDLLAREESPAKRTRRLMVATGLLALLAIALLCLTGGSVNALVLLYAMAVFAAFSMTGYAMIKHHLTHRDRGWQLGVVINLAAAVLASIVFLVFAVTKLTEGAWLVLLLFPVLVVGLTLANRE
jgi:amino acid transporter